jgi:hypothetical protein
LSPNLTENQKVLLLDKSASCDDESNITHDIYNFGLTTVIVSVTLGKCANFIRRVCRAIIGHLYLDSVLTKWIKEVLRADDPAVSDPLRFQAKTKLKKCKST